MFSMPRTVPVQQTMNKPLVLTKAVVNTATYQLSPDKKEWDFAVLLVRLFRSLDSIVGGAADDAKKWLASENRALAGKKPVDLIESTEGLVRVVTYLDACRAVICSTY